jgi:hypothetical protein
MFLKNISNHSSKMMAEPSDKQQRSTLNSVIAVLLFLYYPTLKMEKKIFFETSECS